MALDKGCACDTAQPLAPLYELAADGGRRLQKAPFSAILTVESAE
jgi:hypothetical protein